MSVGFSSSVMSSMKKELVCFVCYGKEDLKDIFVPHDYEGGQEIYSHIIQQCFNIQILPASSGLCLLCSDCVNQLRTTAYFRSQIQYAAQNLLATQEAVHRDDSSVISDWSESYDVGDSEDIAMENETMSPVKKEISNKDSSQFTPPNINEEEKAKICKDLPLEGQISLNSEHKINVDNKLNIKQTDSRVSLKSSESSSHTVSDSEKIESVAPQKSIIGNEKTNIVTEAQKKSIIKMFRNGSSKPSICDKYNNIRRSTIYEILSKESIEIPIESSILTTDRTVGVPRDQKLAIIKLFQAGTSKPDICDKYKNIRRSTIYEILTKERMEEILTGKVSKKVSTEAPHNASNKTSTKPPQEGSTSDLKKMKFPPDNENKLETVCNVCGEKFPHNFAMRKHIYTHYPNFVCESCGKAFPYQKLLNYHLEKHHNTATEIQMFPCELCDKSFKSQDSKRAHVNIKHKGKPPMFNCSECGDRFTSFVLRNKHLAEVHGHERPRYNCEFCDSSYFKPCQLRKHIDKTHNQKRDFPCSECGKAFFDRDNLKKHGLVHSDVKNFPCEFCGKAFKCKKHLVQHLKTHATNK